MTNAAEAALRDALIAHNDALRSAYQVAQREGKDTNWRALRGNLMWPLAEHHETVNAARSALSQPSPASSTAQEVVTLVIAAREAWEEHGASGDDLDRALEKFAALVPYENEPETEPLSPSSGEPASVAVEADPGPGAWVPAEQYIALRDQLEELSKPTPVEAGLRERIARIISPIDWQMFDDGVDLNVVGFSTGPSLAKADRILAALSETLPGQEEAQ